ncbi:hypothetical protein D3C85_1397450 [compost metagenome]
MNGVSKSTKAYPVVFIAIDFTPKLAKTSLTHNKLGKSGCLIKLSFNEESVTNTPIDSKKTLLIT